MIEKYTEQIVLKEMNVILGKNDFGYVFPQGDVSEIDKINYLLKKAGGKPKKCDINNYAITGKGKARPEFIVTFNDDINTIIVVECKNATNKHQSKELDQPSQYAVDGVLYYAKFLKEEYNVIAIAVSGSKKDNILVDNFYWSKGADVFSTIKKAKGIVLEPLNYINLINGEKLSKKYSLTEIREIALDMHESLRQIKVSERHKPIFIAGILIGLEDKAFEKEYHSYTTPKSVISKLNTAIDDVLTNINIKKDKIDHIKSAFKVIGQNEKLKSIPLGHKNSITWYIEQLELKIKPMMNYTESTIDALGIFYHEFVKYSGGDGKGLGIVLTPQHLTEFMCNLANVNKNSKVVDICCGSGSFLVSAMSQMFQGANNDEIIKIKSEGLYGVELDPELYTLSVANMIVRKDGKSNIFHGDCFNEAIIAELKTKNLNVGLINPPYSQKDKVELEFVDNMLNVLQVNSIGVAVVPMSSAIGTKFAEIREKLFKNHTLDAVFSMPDDIFYPTGTNVCVMVWKAHVPHSSSYETFFGYYKDDGYEKRKKLGRIDVNNTWTSIKTEWLSLYRNRDVVTGYTARKCVSHDSEWLCEAYMETDYSALTTDDFNNTLKEYYAYLVRSGELDEN